MSDLHDQRTDKNKVVDEGINGGSQQGKYTYAIKNVRAVISTIITSSNCDDGRNWILPFFASFNAGFCI